MPSRRIAVVFNTAGAYGRGVFRGVMRYRLAERHLQVLKPPQWSDREDTRWQASKVDGYVVEVMNDRMLQALQQMKLPVVNVAGNLADNPFPTVMPDDRAVGRLAAEHFLDRGFRSFGYVGTQTGFSRLRGEGFCARLKEDGWDCSVCEVIKHADDLAEIRWLQSLPKPAGVFVHDDYYASCILHRCQEARIAVPEQLAVLGVDDDELCRDWGGPSLSSIPLPSDQIGYKAAELLAGLMEGVAAPTQPILLPPLPPVVRQSTDSLAIHDSVVAQAAGFIRQHAHEPINVEDVIGSVLMGRRTLELRFQKALGRTLLEEITRVRVERVCQLLRATDLAMPQIAKRTGFNDPTYMASAFRRKMGVSPRDYRRQYDGNT